MIANLYCHYGSGRMPFGRELPAGMLHRHDARNQAAASITCASSYVPLAS